MARIARGDEAAFAELYDRLGTLAYSLAVRILRNPALAEEATQEAFVAVWRGAARFDARRGSARAWVLLQVRARAIDRVRHEERRGGAMVEADDETLESASSAARRRGLGAARAGEPRGRARDHSGPRARADRARLLRGLHAVRARDAARAPLGTVKRRTFDGLARLRTILEGDR